MNKNQHAADSVHSELDAPLGAQMFLFQNSQLRFCTAVPNKRAELRILPKQILSRW